MSEEMTRKERRVALDATEAARNAAIYEQHQLADAQQHQYWGMPRSPDERVASPERLAYEAFQRGDRMFQIDLPVTRIDGSIGFGTHATRIARGDDGRDVLGAVEAQGWRLEHVSTTYVEQGSSATKRLGAFAGSTLVATHGVVMGLYVFRRVQRS